MDSYSVQAVLSVTDKNFTLKVNRAVNSLEGLDDASQKTSSGIMDIAKGVGAFKVVALAADTLKASLTSAVNRFDTLNQYPKVMQNLGYTTEDASKSLSKLSDGIQGVPTALDDAATYTKQWALATGDLEKATNLFLAINDGAIAYGASAEQAASCQEQLNQMISTGSYDLQSWKIVNQNCPGLLDAVAQSMLGESAAAGDLRTALNDGSVTTEQFENTLIALDQNGSESVTAFSVAAQTASGGITTSVTNMKTAVVRGMESVIRSTNDALENNGLPGFQDMIEDSTVKINAAFKVAADGAELLIGNLDVLVPVLGTVTAGFIAYKAAIDISDKHAKLKKGMANAVAQLDAVKNKTDLASRATGAYESAIISTEIAEERMAKARSLEVEALKAQTKAKELSTKATKAQKKADSEAEKVQTLKIKATKDQEAADRAAKRAQESKTASTKLQERAEIAAAKAEESRIAATEAETTAAKLQTKADTLNATATEVQATADKKATIASIAKADAERMETIATTQSTHAEELSAAATTANAKAAEVSNIAVAAKTALLGFLSGEYTLVEAGQLAWNAAMAANPIGTVIVAATALVGVFVDVSQVLKRLDGDYESLGSKMKKSQKVTEELIESLEESREAREDESKEIENSAKVISKLADETVELANKTDRSTDETAKLKANIDSLNKSIDGLNLAYDEETDLLNMTTDALKANSKAYAEQEKHAEALEAYNEVLTEQESIVSQLEEAKGLLTEAEDEYARSLEIGSETSAIAAIRMKEQEDAVKSLEEKKKSLGEEEQSLANKVSECAQAATAATAAAAASQVASNEEVVISLEDLTDEQETALERITGVYETMTDSLGSLNEKIELDTETTWATVQKNQADALAKTQEFADLYAQAINAGVSESYLNAIGATGPEALPLLRQMMSSSIDEVLASQAQWESAYDSINNTFTNSLKMGDAERAAIQEYISGQSGVLGTLQAAVEAADFASIGKDGADGYAEGWADTSSVDTAVQDTVTSGIETAETTQDSGSPSRIYKGIGEDAISGYILGIVGKQGELNSTMQTAMTAAMQIVQEVMSGTDFSTAWNRAFSGMLNAASSNMSKTTSVIRSGMTASNTAVSSGTASMQRTMNAGMTSMSAMTKTRMVAMEKQGTMSMSQFARAIADGMSRSKVNAANGVSGIVSTLSPMQTRFYNSGYYASIGLANGISAGSSAAIAAANRLANQVAVTMERALKIGSPSRVTRELGGYTTKGFALGLLDKIRAVKEAALEVAQMAVPTGDIANRAACIGTYSPASTYENLGQNNAAYTIVVPLSVDGREFARATATYTQEELDSMEKFKNYRKGYR